MRNAASNFLRLPRVPTLLGYDPMVQVIHEADVVSAIVSALTPEVRGIFNIAGPEPMPLSRVLHILDRPTLPVPYSLAKSLINRLISRIRAL